MSFAEVVEYTGIQEGTIVRSLVRLEELLRKIKTIGEALGNDKLIKIADRSILCIKRDIVFAPSLYFQ